MEKEIELLKDQRWRLSNLYSIVDKYGIQRPFKMNWAQEELYNNLWYCNVVLKARQLGISTFISILFLDVCLFHPNVSCGIIAHTQDDARKLFKRVKFAYDSLPEVFKKTNRLITDSQTEIRLENGSQLSIGTSMRSSTLQYLHISEFGKICAKFPDKAQEIITGSLNTIAPGQYIFIESTAEGRSGYFYDMCQKAQLDLKVKKELSNLDFRFHFFPWWKEPSYVLDSQGYMPQDLVEYITSLRDIGIELNQRQINWYALKYATQQDDMKREFPSTPEEAWETSLKGAYYTKQIQDIRISGRIQNVLYDENLPVHTAWDLGYNDSTSIVFFQIFRKEIRIIDFIEGSGESMAYWIETVLKKPYVFGKHLAPHDINIHEYGTGVSRLIQARSLGIQFYIVPKTSVMDGINCVRTTLSRCYFNEKTTEKLVESLENYKKKWDDRNGVWSDKPCHDEYSHAADAFRMMCVGLPLVESRKSESQKFRERMDELKDQSGVYPGSYLYTGDLERIQKEGVPPMKFAKRNF